MLTGWRQRELHTSFGQLSMGLLNVGAIEK
jgi:hypothetical protein